MQIAVLTSQTFISTQPKSPCPLLYRYQSFKEMGEYKGAEPNERRRRGGMSWADSHRQADRKQITPCTNSIPRWSKTLQEWIEFPPHLAINLCALRYPKFGRPHESKVKAVECGMLLRRESLGIRQKTPRLDCFIRLVKLVSIWFAKKAIETNMACATDKKHLSNLVQSFRSELILPISARSDIPCKSLRWSSESHG